MSIKILEKILPLFTNTILLGRQEEVSSYIEKNQKFCFDIKKTSHWKMELKYILEVTMYLKSNSTYHFISFYLYVIDHLQHKYVYLSCILCPGAGLSCKLWKSK